MCVRKLIQKAVDGYGSQAALGRAIGVSQNAIWQAIKRNSCSAEMAAALDRATEGKISKEELRPDIFCPTEYPECEQANR